MQDAFKPGQIVLQPDAHRHNHNIKTEQAGLGGWGWRGGGGGTLLQIKQALKGGTVVFYFVSTQIFVHHSSSPAWKLM